jgi:hypothetical protein
MESLDSGDAINCAVADQNLNSTRPKAICILGMHRSGTSTVSRSANLLGVYLGNNEDLIQPLDDNPEGFWERNDITYLHNRLLSALSLRWDSLLSLPDGWHKLEVVAPFREELRQIVLNNFSDQSLWGWKDPRTCLFFDLWKDVLTELGVDLSILYVVRKPSDVAKSLKKRNGFTMDKGYGIWLNYNLSALNSIIGNKVTFVSYDTLLDEGEAELRRCADDLEIDWPEDDVELNRVLSEFLRKDLRHSKSENIHLPNSVKALSDLLDAAVVESDFAVDDLFQKKIVELFENYKEFSEFMRQDYSNLYEIEQSIALKDNKTLSYRFEKRMKKIKMLFRNIGNDS